MQVSDVKGYAPIMDQPGPLPCVLLADKGYDADFILADLEARGVAAVIPAKRNRKVQPAIDGHIYALRNLVERCFSKLKHSRRLATRYDKTADSFLGFVLVASIRLWARHFVHTTYYIAESNMKVGRQLTVFFAPPDRLVIGFEKERLGLVRLEHLDLVGRGEARIV
jgi:transposase